MEGIRIVRGNDFYLMIPIRKIVFSYDKNGKEIKTGQRVNLCNCKNLSVRLFWCSEECSKPTTFYISEHDESQLIVKVCGKIIPLGWYGIEVTGIYDGSRIRSFERKVFKIVDNNGDSNVSTSIYNGEVSYPVDVMWTLHNAPSESEIKKQDVKSIGVNGNMYTPDKNGHVVLPNYPVMPEIPDIPSVGGYKICVLFPAQFDPSNADENTIYFIVKQGDNIKAIPETIEQNFEIGGSGYMPIAEAGWHFDTQPAVCINSGVYEFPISLDDENSYWADGTKAGKVLRVEIKPYIINIPPSVTIQATGNIIPVNMLCSLPDEAECSYEVIEGDKELRDAGTYKVRLSIGNPNFRFASGDTAELIVYVTASTTPAVGWKFGDGFPIVFSDGQGQQSQSWKFGDGFPIVFNNI